MQTKCYRMMNFSFCEKCYQGTKLTAKIVDEDPASYKRWISRRDLISQNIRNQKRRRPKTTAKLTRTMCIVFS